MSVAANVHVATVARYETGAALKPSSFERIEAALDALGLSRFKRAGDHAGTPRGPAAKAAGT